jgi:hypothetical protein
MSPDTAHTELMTLLTQYATGAVDATALHTALATPSLQAALRALVGQTLTTPQGDQITIGDIADANGVAVGAHTLAIGEIVVHVTDIVAGNHTNIAGNVTGPVFSGTFSGPVTISYGADQSRPAGDAMDTDRQAVIREKKRRLGKLELTAARYGINTPPEVTIEIEDLENEIAELEQHVAATPKPPRASRPATSTAAALKRATLERRIAALTEEYLAINRQVETTLDAAQKLRLERKAADLLAEIERAESELQS